MLTMANPAESWDRNPVTPTECSALRGQVHSFEGMAAVLIENLPLIGRGDPESVTVARVTSNYFALLGVPAHVGRTFVPGEGPAKQQFNVIISSDLWQRKFNADPAIVGKIITLGGQIYTVIGIMPEQFKYAFMPCAIWIPDSFDAQSLGSGSSALKVDSIVAGRELASCTPWRWFRSAAIALECSSAAGQT